MEKPAAVRPKHGSRLLKCILALVIAILPACRVWAERISQSYISTLEFTAQDGYFFTDRECLYSLEISGVTPDEVQVFFDTTTEGVQFVSAKKADSIGGTQLQVRVQFTRPGTYTLPPVYVRIQQREYSIPFARVTVYQNPQTVTPELSVVFSNPKFNTANSVIVAEEGEKLDFTIYIKYAIQIVGFTWEIPQDSLFEELREYEITQGKTRGTEFSPDAIPVATFRWQPLVQGTYTLPKIILKATAYNGSRTDLMAPPYQFTILPQAEEESEATATKKESVFAYAFAPPPVAEEEEPLNIDMTPEEYQTLLELRRGERHSFPLSDTAKERRAMEEKFNLVSNRAEPSIPLFVILVSVTALMILLAVLFFVFRRIPLGAIFVSLALLSGAATATTAIYIAEPTALFKGGELCSIPEQQVSTGVLVRAGSRVAVRQSAGGWVYIQYKELKGWVRESDIDYVR